MSIKLSKEELEHLKKTELEILKVVLKIINDLNLTYFAVGGTALGAIKYSGFIPWDDDIDIAMPRDDFEVFKEKAASYLPNFYFLQCHETDKEFFLDMIKIRDTRTIYIESSTANFDIVNGVFIDIFPIDGNGNKKSFKKSLKYRLRSTKYFQLFNSPNKTTFKGKLINVLSRCLLRNKSLDYCYSMNKKTHTKYALTKSQYCYCRTQVIKTEYFMDSTTKSFEGLELILPKNYDSYLTDCFGNYKNDLPDSKKVSHHYCLFFYIPDLLE